MRFWKSSAKAGIYSSVVGLERKKDCLDSRAETLTVTAKAPSFRFHADNARGNEDLVCCLLFCRLV